MARYGSRDEVQAQAAAGQDRAKDALWSLDLLEEDPSLLDEINTLEDIFEVDENDLAKLTAARLQMVEVLKGLGEATPKELALALGRDQTDVMEDITVLEAFFLIESHRHGKEKRLWVNANEVTFAF